MKMEIAFPTKQRCLPITCHNIVLFHLLKHIPRVLAELCEEYRISLVDRATAEGPQDSDIFHSHDCGEHPSFSCVLKSLKFCYYGLRDNSLELALCYFRGLREVASFRSTGHRIPDRQAALRVMIGGRSALDILYDATRDNYISTFFVDMKPVSGDVYQLTNPEVQALSSLAVSSGSDDDVS